MNFFKKYINYFKVFALCIFLILNYNYNLKIKQEYFNLGYKTAIIDIQKKYFDFKTEKEQEKIKKNNNWRNYG